jgi:hypothetical protein
MGVGQFFVFQPPIPAMTSPARSEILADFLNPLFGLDRTHGKF